MRELEITANFSSVLDKLRPLTSLTKLVLHDSSDNRDGMLRLLRCMRCLTSLDIGFDIDYCPDLPVFDPDDVWSSSSLRHLSFDSALAMAQPGLKTLALGLDGDAMTKLISGLRDGTWKGLSDVEIGECRDPSGLLEALCTNDLALCRLVLDNYKRNLLCPRCLIC